MSGYVNIPWENIMAYLTAVGRRDDMKEFVKEALEGIRNFIPFDAAIAFINDSNGRIRNHYALHYDEHHSEAYLKYYQHSGDTAKYMSIPSYISVVDWAKEKYDNEFLNDYIKMRKLKHSMNFALFYPGKTMRISFCLDRNRDLPFSKKEIQIAEILVSQLENLAKKFYFSAVNASTAYDRKLALMKMANLTKRETEIALQLCNGVSPNNLSKTMHIAQTTIYKHLARIYEKMNVSNLQELLVYLFNPEAFML